MKSDENLIVPASRDPQEPEKSAIKEYLKDNGLPLKWLAAQLGLSDGTVKNWFYSSTKISDTNLFKVNEIIKDHANGLIDSSFWDKKNYAITPTDKGEWEKWVTAAKDEGFDSVELWASQTLNEVAEYIGSRSSQEGETRVWIHPVCGNSLLLWRSAFLAGTQFMRNSKNNYIKDPSSILADVLDKEAQAIISIEKKKNKKFSLKNAKLGDYDKISDKEAENRRDNGEYVYSFTEAQAYLWLIACGIRNKNVNTWANEVLDKKAEEAIFNKINPAAELQPTTNTDKL